MISSVGIELVSSSARVTSVKSQKALGLSDIQTHRSDPGIAGSDKKLLSRMKSTDGQFWRPEAAETLFRNDNIARIANAVPLFKGHYKC